MSLITGNPTPYPDMTLLLSANPSGNVSNTSNSDIGSPIDTTGQGFIVWTVSGNSSFQMTIEGSNDLNFWATLWTLPISEVAQVDTINQTGNYLFETATRYVRYNLAHTSGPLNFTVYGRNGNAPSAADRISAAMDLSNNVALSVYVVNQKKDSSGAAIASDAPTQYVNILQNASSNVIFDTTGYSSIVFQQNGGGASPVTISNDGVNWTSAIGTNMTGGQPIVAALPGAASMSVFTCSARYVRVQGTSTAAQLITYLRVNPTPGAVGTQSSTGQGVNITGINSVTAITGGINGSMATGGGVATNVALATHNPLAIGGSDGQGIARRAMVANPNPTFTSARSNANSIIQLTNLFGNITNVANVGFLATTPIQLDQANNLQAAGVLSTSFQNIPAQPVTVIDQNEGMSHVQLLAQILLELQILNHQFHQLPLLLNSGIAQAPDEPAALRQETSLFNTQNQ